MRRYIEPEISGGLGDGTIVDRSNHPPIITNLNLEFFGWLGDDIIETFPCYFFTEELKKAIEKNKLSGVIFDDDFLISMSEEFQELFPNTVLPKFFWAKILGGHNDDFCIGKDYRLIVSENAYSILQFFKVNNARFEDFVN